jgi:hypothetical protein
MTVSRRVVMPAGMLPVLRVRVRFIVREVHLEHGGMRGDSLNCCYGSGCWGNSRVNRVVLVLPRRVASKAGAPVSPTDVSPAPSQAGRDCDCTSYSNRHDESRYSILPVLFYLFSSIQ